MSKRRPDHKTNFDRYELHLAWLLGAFSDKKPGSMTPPLNPVLRAEFDNGGWAHRRGYVRLTDDCDPWGFIKRLKADHELRHRERRAA